MRSRTWSISGWDKSWNNTLSCPVQPIMLTLQRFHPGLEWLGY